MKNKILQISLVGNTNSGKSTFLNRVIGKNISITSKRINTTLESITGVLNKKNNQILLYDTPGLSFLKSKDQKNKLLKINLWQSIENSKLVLYFIDSKNKNLILNNDLLKEIKSKNQKIFLILNKIDLIKKNHLLLKMDYLYRKYNISNISEYDLPEVCFGYWVDNAIGGDGADDEVGYFNDLLDMSYWKSKIVR